MSRDLTPGFATALVDQNLRPVIFFEGVFASGTVRFWSGLGDVVWNAVTWTGAGTLLGIGAIEETGEIVANGTAVTLSGVPPELVSAAITDARQGLPGSLWLGLLTTAGAIIADPVLIFTGRLDVPQIADSMDSCTITISYESRLIDLNVPREFRYTNEGQLQLYPTDYGFAYVTSIQEQEIVWGRS